MPHCDLLSNILQGLTVWTGSSNISIGAAPLLIMELAYPQHRGKLTTLYNTLWYVGSIIAAWTVYGTVKYTGNTSWRLPVALQALMPFIQLLGVFTLPESPRWLCSKARGPEALEILAKVGTPSLPSRRLYTHSVRRLTHSNSITPTVTPAACSSKPSSPKSSRPSVWRRRWAAKDGSSSSRHLATESDCS